MSEEQIVQHHSKKFKLISLEEAQEIYDGYDVFRLSISTTKDGQFQILAKLLVGAPRGSTVGKTIYGEDLGYVKISERNLIPELSAKYFPAYSEEKICEKEIDEEEFLFNIADEEEECTCFEEASERFLDKLFSIYILGDDLDFDVWVNLLAKQFYDEKD